MRARVEVEVEVEVRVRGGILFVLIGRKGRVADVGVVKKVSWAW